MSSPSKSSIFLVHGRDKQARLHVKELLGQLSLQAYSFEDAVLWLQKGAPFAREVLECAMQRVYAIVVLMTGDDEGRLRPEFCDSGSRECVTSQRARENVIFEAGLAMGLFPDKTVIVKKGRFPLPSDLTGIIHVELDPSNESRIALANRLRAIGCKVVVPRAGNLGTTEPPDFGLPPVGRSPQSSSGGKLALIRKLSSSFLFPSLGGNIEITVKSEMGDKLTLVVQVPADVGATEIQHWLPGSASPTAVDLSSASDAGDHFEIPMTIAGPAGYHIFDLVDISKISPEILARTVCRVAEG
jgi:hypothetical protein